MSGYCPTEPNAIPGPPRQVMLETRMDEELPLKAMQSSPALYVKLWMVMSEERHVSTLEMV